MLVLRILKTGMKNVSSKKPSSESSKFWGELNSKVKSEIAKFKSNQNKARAKKGLPPKVFSAEEGKNIKRMFEKRLTPQILKSLGLKKPLLAVVGFLLLSIEGISKSTSKKYSNASVLIRKKHVFNNLLFYAKKPESEHYKKLQRTNIRWLKKFLQGIMTNSVLYTLKS